MPQIALNEDIYVPSPAESLQVGPLEGNTTHSACSVCAKMFYNTNGSQYCSAVCRMQAYPTVVSYGQNDTHTIHNCNVSLLWGELGWQIGSIATDKYTTKFLAIADKVLDGDYDRQGIVSLLQEIESDGYKVDWDSCVEIDSEPQSRWLCFKITVLKWFRRLLGE